VWCREHYEVKSVVSDDVLEHALTEIFAFQHQLQLKQENQGTYFDGRQTREL